MTQKQKLVSCDLVNWIILGLFNNNVLTTEIICHQTKWEDGYKHLIAKDVAGGSHGIAEGWSLRLPDKSQENNKKIWHNFPKSELGTARL